MACTHCGKHLSRKTARQIDGVVICLKERGRLPFRHRATHELSPYGSSPYGWVSAIA